jgi:hypothetical protein
MASLKSEAARIMNKFNEGNFNLWRFKIRMLLAFVNLWDIVDGPEETLPSNADPKVLKEYQRSMKKVTSIIDVNLVDNQLTHIKSWKGPAEPLANFFARHPLCTLYVCV